MRGHAGHEHRCGQVVSVPPSGFEVPLHALVVPGYRNAVVEFQRTALVFGLAAQYLYAFLALFLYRGNGPHEILFGHVALIQSFVLIRRTFQRRLAGFPRTLQLGARLRFDLGLK